MLLLHDGCWVPSVMGTGAWDSVPRTRNSQQVWVVNSRLSSPYPLYTLLIATTERTVWWDPSMKHISRCCVGSCRCAKKMSELDCLDSRGSKTSQKYPTFQFWWIVFNLELLLLAFVRLLCEGNFDWTFKLWMPWRLQCFHQITQTMQDGSLFTFKTWITFTKHIQP